MEPSADTAEPLPEVVPFRPRGHPLAAWLVILACIVVFVWDQVYRRAARDANAAGSHRLLVVELQSRLLVGTAALHGQSEQGRADLVRQAALLNTGSGAQRLRAAIVIGELSGPAAARSDLAALPGLLARRDVELAPRQEELRKLLLRLYEDYSKARWDGPSLSAAERDQLRRELGWFGELALAPAAGTDAATRTAVLAPARRSALMLLVFALAFVVCAAAGLVGLFLLLVFWARGRLRTRFQTGSPAGGIYAETFALWLVLFEGLTYLVSQLRLTEYGFALLGVPGLLSLLALGWPILRGYSWRQVRQEIGLTAGPRRAFEPLFGLVAYVMALPLGVLGLLIMLLLLRIQTATRGPGASIDPGAVPSHPIVDALLHLSGWERVQLFVLACVIAPLVEETMFRGVLYRHLREATGRLSPAVGAFLSATAVSFLFAVIHPQGFLAVPVLMALAYAFALAREWRDTLVPGMVAHGLNNGIAFTLFLLLMSP